MIRKISSILVFISILGIFVGCKNKETYTVSFDSNGGSGNMAAMTFMEGEPQTLHLNLFTYCDNAFSSWNTMSNGSGTTYNDGQAIIVNSDLTLYAQWNMTTYTVNFNANGGVGDMDSQTFNSCEEKALPLNLFSRENYWFVGWNTAPDGTGISYDNQQRIAISDNITLYAKWSAGVTGNAVGYDYVDLGLPSGTKWATYNIGTSVPEGYGNYFAWGETAAKWTYTWRYYDYAEGATFDDPRLIKYCCNSEYGKNGFTDNLVTLQAEDDAAAVNWGAPWRMPTSEEMRELKNNCTIVWITHNNIGGMLFTGNNGNSVFFPAAGRYHESSVSYCDYYGMYWSSSLRIERSYSAWGLSFISDTESCFIDGYGRDYGFSVRPVCR